MVKKVQMYAEKVAARYDPHSNPVWGLSPPPPPHITLKSWQVWNRVKMKLDVLAPIMFATA